MNNELSLSGLMILLLPFVASLGAMLDGLVNHEATDALVNRIVGMTMFALWSGIVILADIGHKERKAKFEADLRRHQEELDALIYG